MMVVFEGSDKRENGKEKQMMRKMKEKKVDGRFLEKGDDVVIICLEENQMISTRILVGTHTSYIELYDTLI